MQCFALTAILSVVWVIIGYSLAFNSNGMEAGLTNLNSFIGGLGTAFLSGVTADSLSGTIPETVFITFQMTFFIITPALIVGAFAERMKFSAVLLFSVLWGIFVYAPICHMTWGGDGSFFGDMGVLDFAGWTCCTHQRGCRSTRRVYCHWQTPGLSRRSNIASQPQPYGRWRVHAVGRLVRL